MNHTRASALSSIQIPEDFVAADAEDDESLQVRSIENYLAVDARDAASSRSSSLTKSDLDRFIETALPGGRSALGRPFHVRLSWMGYGWFQSPTKLAYHHVEAHLKGALWIAPQIPEKVDYFEIDLDAKTPAARATLADRLWEVTSALKGGATRRRTRAFWTSVLGTPDLPGIVWQSSRDGGLRYRVVLNKSFNRNQLHDRVADVLRRNGIEIKGGEVEIFPTGCRGCRSPLGRGCMLMNQHGDPLESWPDDSDGTLMPLALGHRWRGRNQVRDVRHFVHVWSRFVSIQRTDATAIFPPAATFSLPPCPTSYAKKKGPAPTVADGDYTPQSRSAWNEHIHRLMSEGAPEGGRFEAARDIIFHLRIRENRADDEVRAMYERWLDTAPHTSKDLSGPNQDFIRANMLKELDGRLSRLAGQIESGRLKPGGGPARGSWSSPLLSSCIQWDTETPGRRRFPRERLLSELLPFERELIEMNRPDQRLHDALAVLTVVLRKARIANPRANSIAIPRGLLKTIMGGGSRKWHDSAGTKMTAYRFLVSEAQDLGVLGAVVAEGSGETRTATTYFFGVMAKEVEDLVELFSLNALAESPQISDDQAIGNAG